jgi:diguanylate cyclase (GGDEF)-like protein
VLIEISGVPKRWPLTRLYLVSLAALLTLFFLDLITKVELSLSIFYLGPISLATWYGQKRDGLIFSTISATAWFFGFLGSGPLTIPTWVLIWNTLVRLGFFVIIALLLSKIREQLSRAETLAVTDTLTGLANSRLFYDTVAREAHRSRRYRTPFTILFVDLDNFKEVNDTQGHAIGDLVLRTVADGIRSAVRHSDLPSRLGGDEFALILPETGYDPAHQFMERMLSRLVQSMKDREWPVTFSIGAVTFEDPLEDPLEMIRMADHLMYRVKREGKNHFLHEIYKEVGKQADSAQ